MALTGERKELLKGAEQVHKFIRDASETNDRMNEKVRLNGALKIIEFIVLPCLEILSKRAQTKNSVNNAICFICRYKNRGLLVNKLEFRIM